MYVFVFNNFLPGSSLSIFNKDYLGVQEITVKLQNTREETRQQQMELESGDSKWHGSVRAIVEAPIDQVWTMVSQTKRLPDWVPMVERCTDLAGQEGQVGYVRLVSGFMFPREDGEMSWIKEKLISMDSSCYSYEYKMETSNVGLDGSTNKLKLVDYGNRSTLVVWSFEIDPFPGASQDYIIDFLGYVYKSSIGRIGSAIQEEKKNGP